MTPSRLLRPFTAAQVTARFAAAIVRYERASTLSASGVDVVEFTSTFWDAVGVRP